MKSDGSPSGLAKSQKNGFLKLLTCTDHLLLNGLVCGILKLIRRLQQKCQSSTLTLDDLERKVDNMITNLLELQETPLLGRWEAVVQQNLTVDPNGSNTFFGQKL